MSPEEVLRTRRSIRRYEPRAVPERLILELLDLARHAPSSMDGQPWAFVVVKDAERKRRMAALKNAHCPPAKSAFPADFLEAAPVVVVVCVERARAHQREREDGVLATAWLLLAAHAHGLGGVYLSASQPDDGRLTAALKELLELPEGIDPVTLVPLGFPDERPGAKTLRPLDELLHEDVYGGGS
jgi:nitroreductase